VGRGWEGGGSCEGQKRGAGGGGGWGVCCRVVDGLGTAVVTVAGVDW